MRVAGHDIHDFADSPGEGRLLPNVDRFSGGDRCVAAAFDQDFLDLDDQGLQLLRRAEAVVDGLVTDHAHLDEVILGPGLDGLDLVGNVGAPVIAANLADKDTNDHFEANRPAGGTDVRKGVAVSRVDTDRAEAVGLDGGDILQNLVRGLA